jgi:hypothetical protein
MFLFIPSQPLAPDLRTQRARTLHEAVIRGHDMRTLGLENASDRLRMVVADLGEVQEARAKVDTKLCPVCPLPHAA